MSRERETDSLEEIGSQFQTIRLKFGVERRTDKFDTVPEEVPRVSLDMVESWTGDVIENREEEPQASAGLVKFHEGDVCFSKLRPYLAKAFEAEYFGAASPEFLVFEPTQFETRFLRYLILSREFIERVDASTYGAKMPRASWNFIGSLRVPCPDKREQREIATFLDRRTARIDALVSKQKRLLDLLAEKRQAIISQSVTSKLKQITETKDTDISWLDSIPSLWNVVVLKYVAEVRTGIAKGKNRDAEDLTTVPYLRVANVQDGYLDLNEVKTLELTEQEIHQYALQEGDVLMNEGGDYDKLGRGTVWDGQINPCVHQNHVFCIRPDDTNNSEWISKLTESSYLKHYFIMNAKQSTNLASISAGNIGGAPLIWPPQEDREEILRDIRERTSRIDELMNRVTQSIDLLSEKRQALITAAVTGQIDVTEGRGEIQDQSV